MAGSWREEGGVVVRHHQVLVARLHHAHQRRGAPQRAEHAVVADRQRQANFRRAVLRHRNEQAEVPVAVEGAFARAAEKLFIIVVVFLTGLLSFIDHRDFLGIVLAVFFGVTAALAGHYQVVDDIDQLLRPFFQQVHLGQVQPMTFKCAVFYDFYEVTIVKWSGSLYKIGCLK